MSGDRPDSDRLLYAAIARSSVAHGVLRHVETARARAMPGVVGTWTGTDLEQACFGPIHVPQPPGFTGRVRVPSRYALAVTKVCHVGEPVAVVIAQSRAEALAAVAAIRIHVDARAPLSSPGSSGQFYAPTIFDGVPENTCLRLYQGEYEKTVRAFAGAAHVARLRLTGNRHAGAPAPTPPLVARYDTGRGRYILSGAGEAGTEEARRSEHAWLFLASQRLGRAIEWIDDRATVSSGDALVADYDLEAELALDRDGHFLALRRTLFINIGACLTDATPLQALVEMPSYAGSGYRIPLTEITTKLVFTNTPPLRSPLQWDRPDPSFVIERLIDTAARDLQHDRLDIRARNHVASGPRTKELLMLLRRVREIGDLDRFAARELESTRRGKLRGFGVSCYSDDTLPPEQAADRHSGFHVAEIEIDPGTGSFQIATYIVAVLRAGTVRVAVMPAGSLPMAGGPAQASKLPAVMNAIVDALAGKHVDAPATPQRIQQALNAPPRMQGLH